MGDVAAFTLAALQSAFDSFGDCDALGQRKAHRRIDADSAISRLFNRGNSRLGDRNLNDHVGRECIELCRLLHDGVRTSEEPRVRLYREATVSSALFLENRF